MDEIKLGTSKLSCPRFTKDNLFTYKLDKVFCNACGKHLSSEESVSLHRHRPKHSVFEDLVVVHKRNLELQVMLTKANSLLKSRKDNIERL